MKTDPVRRIADILEAAGYKVRERLVVMSIPFEFGAVLIAPDRLSDLIVVADTAIEAEQELQDKVIGLSRALDVSRSIRPLTTVLVGPRPRPSTIEAIAKASRVLSIGPISDAVSDARVRDRLAILLPFDPSLVDRRLADPMRELERELGELALDSLAAKLVEASQHGKKGVEAELRRLLAEPLSAPEKSND